MDIHVNASRPRRNESYIANMQSQCLTDACCYSYEDLTHASESFTEMNQLDTRVRVSDIYWKWRKVIFCQRIRCHSCPNHSDRSHRNRLHSIETMDRSLAYSIKLYLVRTTLEYLNNAVVFVHN